MQFQYYYIEVHADIDAYSRFDYININIFDAFRRCFFEYSPEKSQKNNNHHKIMNISENNI